MKKSIYIAAIVVTMALLSTPSAAGVALKAEAKAPASIEIKNIAELERQAAKIAEMERLAAEQTERDIRTQKVNHMVELLKGQVGKTWYVFSGSTPSGWDCSGMVRWGYEQIGVELEHRASVQKYAGEFVTEPKVGDIVAFSYGKGAFHTGIWIGPDTMIHAGGQKGDRTEIIPISTFESGSTVTYTRLLDTN